MKNEIIILSIDPGLTNTGWAITKYNRKTDTAVVTQFDIIQAKKIAHKTMRGDNEEYPTIIPVIVYEQLIDEILRTYEPDYITSEDAFYNPKRPNAYISLSLCLHAIERVLYTHRKSLYRIAPRSIKQVASGSGDSGKIAMQEAVLHLDNVTIKDRKIKPVSEMVEHEADAIAVGYTFIKKILPGLF